MTYSASKRLSLLSAVIAVCLPTLALGASSNATPSAPSVVSAPATPADAARFLQQATFGSTIEEAQALTASDYKSWLNAQFAMPVSTVRPFVEANLTTDNGANRNLFQSAFWKEALTGKDELRARVAFTLSQIFVVSFEDGVLYNQARGVANYYDLLSTDAFGNFRTLLQDVTLSPMMGAYLTSFRNVKENTATGRHPDENYAREVMQLFTIGLVQLNQDGTAKLDSSGRPLETYTNDDIAGLAKVFTGYACANTDTSNAHFYSSISATTNCDVTPMQMYPQFHSTTAKTFLGVTTAANATPASDLSTALDTLFNHPNVGPFIGKQLIQKLVKSNPSPAYVSRVAAAFNNNGSGVRGDMKAVITAVLLDPEARTTNLSDPNTGRLREPILRMANAFRAFHATSVSGNYLINVQNNASNGLGESAMYSQTVFNFFRPDYAPAGSALASAGLMGGELQLSNETSVAGFANYIWSMLVAGAGVDTNGIRDVQANFNPEVALGDDQNLPNMLSRLNIELTAGQLSSTDLATISKAVSGISLLKAKHPNVIKLYRAELAAYLMMMSESGMILK